MTPTSWFATLYLTVDGTQVTSCPAGIVWKWHVQAVATEGEGKPTITQPKDGCSPEFETTRLGTYRVTAQRYKQTAKGLVKTKLTVTTGSGNGQPPDVVLNDLLIVGLGDSNGSGEGDLPFYFGQCDRGTASYQYQAAENLEKQLKGHTSVTFVADACSGATIQNLLTSPYAGAQPGSPLAPQILALKALVAVHPDRPQRHVDAAFVSVGINNVGFGPFLEYCTYYPSDTVTGAGCEDQKVEPTYGSDGSVVGFSTRLS